MKPDKALQITDRARHWSTVNDGLPEPVATSSHAQDKLIASVASAVSTPALPKLAPKPSTPERAVKMRATRLHQLARQDCAEVTTTALRELGLTPNARHERGKRHEVLPTLINATRAAILRGNLKTARVLKDRCTWTEWAKVATFTVQRTAQSNDARRQFIFECLRAQATCSPSSSPIPPSTTNAPQIICVCNRRRSHPPSPPWQSAAAVVS